MRAGGREAGRARGGTGSPRGPFLRLWGVYARGPPSALGGLLRAACSASRGAPSLACGAFLRLAGFLCAECLYV